MINTVILRGDTMIYGISLIGIGVKNIESSLEAFAKALNVKVPEIGFSAERNMRFAVIDIGGVGIEFLEDSSENGRVANFVKENGDGIEHICFLTDNIEGDMEQLKQQDLQFVNNKPNIGLRGKKVAFSKGGGLKGIKFELSEP